MSGNYENSKDEASISDELGGDLLLRQDDPKT